jgi:hypothetical protein
MAYRSSNTRSSGVVREPDRLPGDLDYGVQSGVLAGGYHEDPVVALGEEALRRIGTRPW